MPALTEALKDDEQWYVRSGAARALGHIGSAVEAAVPALTEALKDPNEAVRWTAASALKALGSS